MIAKIISSSRTTEVDGTVTRIIGAYNNTSLGTEPFLSAFFTALAPVSENLGAAINRIKAESDLEEKDEIRDKEVSGLGYMLLGYLHNPAAAIQNAAQQLENVFGNYGFSMTSESYVVESSLIDSLLTDLGAPGLQDSIAALPGCAEQIAALQAAANAFEAARIAYETEKGHEGLLQNATEIKSEVVKMVNEKLVVYLRAMLQANEATYGDFIRTVAAIIADNNENVKRRRNNAAA